MENYSFKPHILKAFSKKGFLEVGICPLCYTVTMQKLIDFLNKLERSGIYYKLDKVNEETLDRT